MRLTDSSWRYSLTATLFLLSPFDLLASLGMDMYLPVLPFMTSALGASSAIVQLTLTAYLVLLGAGQLLFGPLSDRVGRRPVLLGGGVAYVTASFGLAAAATPEAFLAFRLVQACGASACLVATFATVRDIYAGHEGSNVIYGLLGSMLAMVPAVGPLLGTMIDAWLGWRAIFGLLGLAMAAALVAAWRLWPETRRRRSAPLKWSDMLQPLKRRHFWLYTLGYSAGMGSFFVFFSTAPGLMMGRLGLSQLGFSLLFATVAIAMMATARVMGRLTAAWGCLRVLRLAMGCLATGSALLAIGQITTPGSVLGFIAPMWLVGAGIAMAVSVAPNGALQGFDGIAGAATAVYFCLGGLLLGGIGTLAIMWLPAETSWPIVGYSAVMAAVVASMSLAGARGHHPA